MLTCTGCVATRDYVGVNGLPLETMIDVCGQGLRILSGSVVLLQARAMFTVRAVTRNYVEAQDVCSH